MLCYTSTITDQIRQDGWAFVCIWTLLAGLCPMGISGGLLLKSVGWYSSDLNMHIKKSPNCTAFSAAWTSPSLHIIPIVMSAPKLESPGNACSHLNATISPTPAHFPDLLQLYPRSWPLHPSTDTRLPQLPLCRCKIKGDFRPICPECIASPRPPPIHSSQQ